MSLALPENVKYLVTHVSPHWDELVAIWQLARFGGRLFPGISQAVVVFWNGGPNVEVLGTTRPLAEIRPFSLFVGTGGGPLDEHTSKGRLKEECAATLAAKLLGIRDSPALYQLLSYTLKNDSKGGTGVFYLPAALRKLPEREAFRTGFTFLDAHYQEQKTFHEVAVPFFRANSRVAIKKEHFVVLAIEGEKAGLAKAARHCAPDHALLVQITQRGINIFANSKGGAKKDSGRPRLELAALAAEIRSAELLKGGQSLPLKEQLTQEGKIPECPEWYYHRLNGGLGGALLNDSATHRGASPKTRLSEAEILGCIRQAFSL